MAVDSEGRLYVTGNKGVHVLSQKGEHLGLTPDAAAADHARVLGPRQEDAARAAVGRSRSRRRGVDDSRNDPQHRDDDLHARDPVAGFEGPAEIARHAGLLEPRSVALRGRVDELNRSFPRPITSPCRSGSRSVSFD